MINRKILFIGNFLSKTRGTVGPVAGVMDRLKNDFHIIYASSCENKFLRLLDMTLKTLVFNYDIIHIDTYSTSAIRFANWMSIIAKFRKKPVILNLHGGALYDQYTKQSVFVKKLFDRATSIITPSLFLQDKFTANGLRINYLPNTVDLSAFSYLQHRDNNHKLLWIRAFSKEYNPFLAIQTLYEVKKKYIDATLTMIGPDKGELYNTRLLAKKLNILDSVTFAGFIPNKDLPNYYHSHQIYLNTTQYESFGVAVLEAAATGIPVVSTSVGELPYIWTDSKNIQFINSYDAKDMAKRVMRYIDKPEFAAKISKTARSKAESFDWENVKEKWITLLQQT